MLTNTIMTMVIQYYDIPLLSLMSLICIYYPLNHIPHGRDLRPVEVRTQENGITTKVRSHQRGHLKLAHARSLL